MLPSTELSSLGQRNVSKIHPTFVLLKLSDRLRQNIIAQDEAVDAVVNVLSYLHTRREMHRFSPLIMAVTGSTGIGKSETAKLIGKGLYGTSSFDDHPCGLLILSGKAYSGISKLRVRFAMIFF
jgi:hypothetical protein